MCSQELTHAPRHDKDQTLEPDGKVPLFNQMPNNICMVVWCTLLIRARESSPPQSSVLLNLNSIESLLPCTRLVLRFFSWPRRAAQRSTGDWRRPPMHLDRGVSSSHGTDRHERGVGERAIEDRVRARGALLLPLICPVREPHAQLVHAARPWMPRAHTAPHQPHARPRPAGFVRRPVAASARRPRRRQHHDHDDETRARIGRKHSAPRTQVLSSSSIRSQIEASIKQAS